MKKVTLIVSGLLSVMNIICIHAQTPVIQWAKTYGGSNADECFAIHQIPGGAYISCGLTLSNDGDVHGLHSVDIGDAWILKTDQEGNVLFAKTYGGSNNDYARSIQQTHDGGYIFAGATESNNGDVAGNHGGSDMWLVKLDSMGNIKWQKCYGGSGNEVANAVQQTYDGGYIMAGQTSSANGQVTGYHGGYDMWVVKTDDTGGLVWQKSLGGTRLENGLSAQQTYDSGYIIAGVTSSTNGDVTGLHAFDDMWLVKLDKNGNILWEKCYGGSGLDGAFCVRQTIDSGYILAGNTSSGDGDVVGYHNTGAVGTFDYWILKLSKAGSIQWQKCLGGSDDDRGSAIEQVFQNGADSGYIVLGYTLSSDGDLTGNKGNYDYWTVRINNSGRIIWEKTLGGSADDIAVAVATTSDTAFVVAGYTLSFDYDVAGNHGSDDFWIVKLKDTTRHVNGINVLSVNDAIKVYPTVTKGLVHIKLPAGYEHATMQLHDIAGKPMDYQAIYNGSEKVISIGNEVAGWYLLAIDNANVTYTYKIYYQPY
ncbi:MAG: T9SS type A sorting domain-containing protein [Taibaiella sp.]|nr:T9SS type A sorting domain-containing protein [Taibaiella sp.]